MARFEPLAGDTLLRLHDRKVAPIDALPTPWPAFNSICGEEGGKVGPAKHWVVIIGGVTGAGKSYVAKNMGAHSVLMGRKVGMVNFEMTQMAVATRYLSIVTGIPKWRLEMGEKFSSEHWLKAKGVVDEIMRETGGAMIANESAVFSIEDIEDAYRQLVDVGVEQIIIDYAQLVTVEGVDNIAQRSERVATRLRELTHEYPVQTIAISQFNREEAKRGKPPTIHGLMGGGIWEHAANQIWLIDHTVKQHIKDNNGIPTGEYTQLLCGKNRHGMAPVEVPMKWSYENMRWDEYLPGSEPGDPFVVDDDATAEYQEERPGVEVPPFISSDGSLYGTDAGDLFDLDEEKDNG